MCVFELDANQSIHETPDSDRTEGFTCSSAHMQTDNQCVLEDDLDDIAAFHVFSKKSSRRLRRTSIEIYRKSLHDAENVECDTIPVTVNAENFAAADVEIHSDIDGDISNEPPLQISDSDDSQTSNNNSKSGIVFMCLNFLKLFLC